MKGRLLFLGFWLALSGLHAAITSPEPRVTAKERQQGYRDTRILAKPRADGTVDLEANETRLGARLRQRFDRFGGLRVLEIESTNLDEIIRRLNATGLYDFVEFDHLRKRHAVPNDPRFTSGAQWSLRNTGQDGGTTGADVGAVAAWNTRSDASSVIVAVIDTGIRTTHEDLAANLWKNPGEIPGNGIDDDANGYVDDVHGINSLAALGSAASGDVTDNAGHGTAVASVIAAVGNNAKGMAGIAWRAQLMALKFDDAEGSSSISNQIECMDYALAKGARILNISYGSAAYSQSEYDAIKRARDASAIVVVSAGNDGVPNDYAQHYPSNHTLDNLVAVAATDRTDTLATFSNYSASLVDLAAPGKSVFVADDAADDAYEITDGTSFAAPLAAGTLALLKAEFPTESYRGLINRLLRSTRALPSLAGKTQTGGRLDAAQALASTTNRPFNDDFASRATLNGVAATVRAHTQHSTAETGEPAHAGTPAHATLWWTWTAPISGNVAVETTGSSFDTVLGVYSGAALASLAPIAANDDTSEGQTSRALFNAVAGETYHLAVGGKAAGSGPLVIQLGYAPTNDNFIAATVLEGSSSRTVGFNTGTTAEAGEPKPHATAKHRTAWYRWTAPSTAAGSYSVSIFAYGFDALLGVWTGATIDALTEVDVGSIFTHNESAIFSPTPGVTYYFQIDSANGATGTFELAVVNALALAGYFPVNSSPAASRSGGIFVSGDTFGGLVFLAIRQDSSSAASMERSMFNRLRLPRTTLSSLATTTAISMLMRQISPGAGGKTSG